MTDDPVARLRELAARVTPRAFFGDKTLVELLARIADDVERERLALPPRILALPCRWHPVDHALYTRAGNLSLAGLADRFHFVCPDDGAEVPVAGPFSGRSALDLKPCPKCGVRRRAPSPEELALLLGLAEPVPQ